MNNSYRIGWRSASATLLAPRRVLRKVAVRNNSAIYHPTQCKQFIKNIFMKFLIPARTWPALINQVLPGALWISALRWYTAPVTMPAFAIYTPIFLLTGTTLIKQGKRIILMFVCELDQRMSPYNANCGIYLRNTLQKFVERIYVAYWVMSQFRNKCGSLRFRSSSTLIIEYMYRYIFKKLVLKK